MSMPSTRGPAVPSAAAAPVLTLAGVRKRFEDGSVALADVHLGVAAGEFVSVVGPSGCGKSTLLRIASGLTAATGGAVEVAARKLGYVFLDPTLLPWRSVQANVELLGELDGLPKAERAAAPTTRSSWSVLANSPSTGRWRCRGGCGCGSR
jgi:NitT/TauT family transport system ATP-binding protein